MKSHFNVQLYKNRKIVWLVSFSLCLTSIIGMLICLKSTSIKAPLNLGLDYTGGTQIILERSCNDDCITLDTSQIANNLNVLKNQDKRFNSNTSPNLIQCYLPIPNFQVFANLQNLAENISRLSVQQLLPALNLSPRYFVQ